MRAFDIHAPLPAAGVVLLVMNVVTIIPFWPGNVGLVQVAIASALTAYGVPYATGVAYGFGLQAIEASVGIGVGLLFLAREGLSFAMLRVMPTADQAELPEACRKAASQLLDLALCGVELRAAERVQLLAALPEGDRLVERNLAALEAFHDLLELRLCLLERRLRFAHPRSRRRQSRRLRSLVSSVEPSLTA